MDYKKYILPHIWNLKPYSSARDEFKGSDGIFLDANENPIGSGLGPIVGGVLNDRVAPVAIWYGAASLAALGVIGFFMRRYGFSVVPVIIGLILGELVEGTLRQSLVIFDGNWLMFLTRPIALTFFILSLIALAFPLLRSKKKKK